MNVVVLSSEVVWHFPDEFGDLAFDGETSERCHVDVGAAPQRGS
jgi:hypothetical protein